MSYEYDEDNHKKHGVNFFWNYDFGRDFGDNR